MKKMHTKSLIQTPLGTFEVSANSNSDIRLATVDLPSEYPNGMKVDKSVACLLTVEPRSETIDIEFSAILLESLFVGAPASGEHLDCIEWETEHWHVTLGAEDQEVLCSRYPAQEIPEDPYPIDYSNSGLTLYLSFRENQKEMTFHFVITYKRLPDDREISAWHFADVPHDEVVKAVFNEP